MRLPGSMIKVQLRIVFTVDLNYCYFYDFKTVATLSANVK